jgi:hypothetical protein
MSVFHDRYVGGVGGNEWLYFFRTYTPTCAIVVASLSLPLPCYLLISLHPNICVYQHQKESNM